MRVIAEEGRRPIKIWTDEVEASALNQLRNLSQLPFLHPHGIAVMPDVHAGIGSTVGTVIATSKAIIPAAVGVDIGCGMNAVRTSLRAEDLPDSLSAIRSDIERAVPLGPGGAHREDQWSALQGGEALRDRFDRLECAAKINARNAGRQIGTLGSGNHFIEICLDENRDVWALLHSGSRGIGNQIGRHYIDKAKRLMERYFIKLPDADLAYLADDTPERDQYIAAVSWAQDYALANRRLMMASVLRALQKHTRSFELTSEAVNCHHNYVEIENHFGRDVYVTRKGAIRARRGDLGVIPGSMGARSYVVRGKGNPDSYCSCSHGAGRRMSRTDAKRRLTVEDLARSTAGVECRKDAGVLDEAPGAYKDIDQVMENQRDLVEIVHMLKQVLCVKGN